MQAILPKALLSKSNSGDMELTWRARMKDPDAFAELVRPHTKQLLNLAFRMTGSREQAQDSVQDAFFAAWRYAAKFRGTEAEFYFWLRRIVVNACLKELKKSSRREKYLSYSVDDPAQEARRELPSSDPDPPARAESAEVRHLLVGAIAGLPAHYRVTFWLREGEQMSYEEIAKALKISVGTVRSRLHEARRILRTRLEQEVTT